MDKDIVPELIENVNKAFEINCMKDGNMQAMAKKLESGAASYEDAYKYAVSVGNARAKAFKSEINSDILPDGRMYYNIADRLINDSLGTDHDMVADYAVRVQDIYNQKENIRLKAQKADKDEDRIKGFINRLDSEENFDDVAWILDEPVKVHAMNVVDNTIKKNAEFQGKAGLKATVTRDAKSDCCGWCTDLAGDYIYPGVPREVFARHDNCRCTLDYAGRRLSAYETGGKAHSFRDQGEQERIEERKQKAQEEIRKIESTPFIIREAVGAMARRFYVDTEKPIKNFEELYIKPGTYVEGVKVIASGREIHDIKRLMNEYKLQNGALTEADDWYKVRGRAMITDGTKDLGKREVHWYQAKNIGKVEFKFPSNEKQK